MTKKQQSPEELAKRTKLKPEQHARLKGSREAFEYAEQSNGEFHRSIKLGRNVYRAWLKSRKFILELVWLGKRQVYLAAGGDLCFKRKDALKFAYGFDDPSVKIAQWNKALGLQFKESLFGKADKKEVELIIREQDIEGFEDIDPTKVMLPVFEDATDNGSTFKPIE